LVDFLKVLRMKNPIALRSDHVRDDEVSFHDGLFSSFIEVTRQNRGEEEIGYAPDQEARVEAALSHRHGNTTYQLNSQGEDVGMVLDMADSHFQFEWKLKDKYGDSEWSGYKNEHMSWEGQKSILVGRCEQRVVSIACVDLRFVYDDIASKKKYLYIGIGPFFVPEHLRGRAHCVEMSIAMAHLSTVLMRALCHQVPDFGYLGISVYPDYPEETDALEAHPFVLQVFYKLKLFREMLAGGYQTRRANIPAKINFLPITLER
jgi:hypothetical protein